MSLSKLLTDRRLTQREIAVLLGIKQLEVSHLMNGHFNRFTTDSCWNSSNGSIGTGPSKSASTSLESHIKKLLRRLVPVLARPGPLHLTL
jgi:transcriptional regulator with XRE-family HTH domain